MLFFKCLYSAYICMPYVVDMVSGRASAARVPSLTFAYGETEAQNDITVQQLIKTVSEHTN